MKGTNPAIDELLPETVLPKRWHTQSAALRPGRTGAGGSRRARVDLASACLLAVAAMTAQELPRGEVVDRVLVTGNDRQSYALYLPSHYTAERTWPVLYCLDPGARGRAPVERFAKAAEKAGWVVVGSNNSRNGPMGPVQEAIGAMLADTHARFSIDDSRVYAAGLSGGARLALSWGLNGHLAGVIACSAAFGPPGTPKQIPMRIFATAGIDDFNHDELYRMSRELARRGVEHRFVEFEGGHEWLPEPLTFEALDFFAGRVPPQAAAESKESEKQAREAERIRAELASASDAEKYSLFKQMSKNAAKPNDSPERRVARRVIGGVSVGAMEETRGLMAEQRYGEAARAAETGVMVRPENGNAWYTLAVAQAGAGNNKRALEALEHAAANGFRAWERMESEPLLAKVRRDARYREVLEKMKQ
ncbi:MAG TPA: hypothetical protein VNY05_27595 [Candidatus Acidoferrales bacterium]|jgi:hypothetical protein|nr:hypothetical protein [Candidatus Acidoferrales bacterium]